MDTSSAIGLRVVVGIEDSATSSAAVAWAVDECAARGADLLIAYCPAPADPRQVWVGGEAALRAMDQRADALLTAFAAAASRRRQSVVVTTHLSHSDPANALIDLSAGSQLVVVGAPGRRSAAFGVGRRVVAHAQCPVVVVPDPIAVTAANRPVRVVHLLTGGPHDAAAGLLAEAEAALRGMPLDVIECDLADEELRSRPAALAVIGRHAGTDVTPARTTGAHGWTHRSTGCSPHCPAPSRLSASRLRHPRRVASSPRRTDVDLTDASVGMIEGA